MSATAPRTAAYLLLTRLPRERRAGLLRRLGREVFTRGDVAIATGLAGGLRLPLTSFPFEHVHAHHLLRGTLEQPVQEALRRHVPRGGVVYDIGANAGFFTLLTARLAGPDGRVYAFEPVPASAAGVRAATGLNGLENVTVLEAAVGADQGRVTLTIPEDSSWAFLERYAPDRPGREHVEVDSISIDELVTSGRLEPPDVVKIDVEGGELDVLAGMRKTIAQSKPAIIAEMHGRTVEFVELMESLGYRVSNLEGARAPTEAGPNVHVLALAWDRVGD